MNFLRYVFFTIMLLSVGNSALAYGNLWYNKDASLGKMTKIVVYPIEGEKAYGADEFLVKRLTDKIKKNYFVTVGEGSGQASVVVSNSNTANLLQDFATEAERGAAIEENLAADAYLICRVRENRVQQDWSPETWVTVSMRSYTQVDNSPRGSFKTDEESWVEDHLVEGGYVNLRHLTLDFVLYNTKGEKVMTYSGDLHDYINSESEQFKILSKEFVDELKKAKKASGGK